MIRPASRYGRCERITHFLRKLELLARLSAPFLLYSPQDVPAFASS